MGDLPEFIQMHHVRRGAALLGAVLNEEGNPVVTYGCDCSAVTEVVLDDARSAPSGTYEVAFTCDGCLTSHWVTFKIGQPTAEHLGINHGDHHE